MEPGSMVVSRSEREAGRSAHPPFAILDRLQLEVRDVRPLHWKQGQITPLYFLDAAEGRFVLKLSTPRDGRTKGFRSRLARHEIAHQARVYRALGAADFRCLRFPRLVASDSRDFLLLEYIETRPHGEHDLPRDALLGSLLEFQTVKTEIPDPLFPNAVRSPGVKLSRTLLGRLRKRIGWRSASAALRVMARCYQQQPRLERKFVRHNDFHYNNLLLGADGTLFFNDFEYVSLDDRWVLGDVVNYAVATHRCHIACEFIAAYDGLLRSRLGIELNLSAQLRFNLLARVGDLILSRVAPVDAVSRYRSFFENVLLDDREFDRWLASRFEAGERECNGRSASRA